MWSGLSASNAVVEVICSFSLYAGCTTGTFKVGFDGLRRNAERMDFRLRIGSYLSMTGVASGMLWRLCVVLGVGGGLTGEDSDDLQDRLESEDVKLLQLLAVDVVGHVKAGTDSAIPAIVCMRGLETSRGSIALC